MTRHLSLHLVDLLQIAQNQTSSEETLTKTKIQCVGPNFMTFIYKKCVQSVCVCYFLIDAKKHIIILPADWVSFFHVFVR